MSWKDAVIFDLGKTLNRSIDLISISPVGGGDINEAYLFDTSAGKYFIKKNSASRFPEMFEKEAHGLKLLSETHAIPVPDVILTGETSETAYLILDFIESAPRIKDFWDDFGKNLAKLHKHSSDFFGLETDNYIGSLYQSNRKHHHWTDFFREERLNVQVKMARDNGRMGRDVVQAFERFYNRIGEIFPEEPPALVHGDLWGGNFMVDRDGRAVIIDPAVYYGHREMDLGMSQLFGGFSSEFYDAYHRNYPLQPGWQERLSYCNLYPLMVHVNLFGGGYIHSVKSTLSQF